MGTKPELTKPKPASQNITKPALKNNTKPALKNNTEPKPLFLENSIKRLNHPISVKQSAVYLVNSV